MRYFCLSTHYKMRYTPAKRDRIQNPRDDQHPERDRNEIGTRYLSGPVLRDTARLSQRYPPIARCGVFGVSTWPIGCDTPSLFSERFPPLIACEVEVRYPPPPPQKGISAILERYPMKTKQMGAIPPSAILSRKGIARYGGASRTGPLSEIRICIII